MAEPVVVMSRSPLSARVDNVVLMVDAAVREMHNSNNVVTDHPVEEGFNVTDHSRPEPDRLQVEAVISNTPLSTRQEARAVQGGGFQFQSTTEGDESPEVSDARGRAAAAYRVLRDMMEAGTLVTVVTSLRSYKSMLIESLSIPREAANSDALWVMLGFKQIRVVRNRLTRVPTGDPRTADAAKTGTQTATEGEVEKSQAARMYDAAAQKTGVIDKLSAALGTFTQ